MQLYFYIYFQITFDFAIKNDYIKDERESRPPAGPWLLLPRLFDN